MSNSASKRSRGCPVSSVMSYTVEQIQQLEQDIPTLVSIAEWTRKYLAMPHRDLGRTGPVCPYAPAALHKQTLRIASIRLRTSDRKREIEHAVLSACDQLLAMQTGVREEDILHALLLVFPDVSLEDSPELIDGTKEKLKAYFVSKGLMLGEFHLLNESPGLHNAEFRPLRSPIPMLALRRMVPNDFVFLNRPEDPAHLRASYIRSYLSTHESLSETDRLRAEAALAEAVIASQLTGETASNAF